MDSSNLLTRIVFFNICFFSQLATGAARPVISDGAPGDGSRLVSPTHIDRRSDTIDLTGFGSQSSLIPYPQGYASFMPAPKGREFQEEEAVGAVHASNAANQAALEIVTAKSPEEIRKEAIALYNHNRTRQEATRDLQLQNAAKDRDFERELRNIVLAKLSDEEMAIQVNNRKTRGTLEGAQQAAFRLAMNPAVVTESNRRIYENICINVGAQAGIRFLTVISNEIYNAWDKWRKSETVMGPDGKRITKKIILTPELEKLIATTAAQNAAKAFLNQRILADIHKTTAESLKVRGEIVLDMMKMMPADPQAAAELSPLLAQARMAHFARVYNHFNPQEAHSPAPLLTPADK